VLAGNVSRRVVCFCLFGLLYQDPSVTRAANHALDELVALMVPLWTANSTWGFVWARRMREMQMQPKDLLSITL